MGKFKSKNWWRMVKYFMSGNSNSFIPALSSGNFVISDNMAKVNVINEFFLQQCRVDASSFTLPDEIPHQQSTREHIELTEDTLLDILKSLKVDKACGPDGISPFC